MSEDIDYSTMELDSLVLAVLDVRENLAMLRISLEKHYDSALHEQLKDVDLQRISLLDALSNKTYEEKRWMLGYMTYLCEKQDSQIEPVALDR